MATSTAKHEFIVILPDREGVIEKRGEVRPSHLKGLGPKVEEGFWTFGGAFLAEPQQQGQAPKPKGSIMLALASSEEEVMEQIRNDVYNREGIWDLEKVQIYPFKTALRKPL